MKEMKKDNKGFSLVELIIVIAIMAVLIGILAPQYLGYVKKSKISTDKQNAEQIATTIAVQISDKEASGTSYTPPTATYADVTDAFLGGMKAPKPQAVTGNFQVKVDGNQVYVQAGGKELYPTADSSYGS